MVYHVQGIEIIIYCCVCMNVCLKGFFLPIAANPWLSSVDANGAYLIDRSPAYFEPILNYLRSTEVILDKNINPQGESVNVVKNVLPGYSYYNPIRVGCD